MNDDNKLNTLLAEVRQQTRLLESIRSQLLFILMLLAAVAVFRFFVLPILPS
jgi:hypothetical protein